MPRYSIVEPEQWHLPFFATHMREADKREVWAAAHQTPYQAVQGSLAYSHRHRGVGTVDDRPVCIFGVAGATVLSNIGVPWMLATDELVEHAIPFLRRSLVWVHHVMPQYDVAFNFVDDRNTHAIQWLKWLGFFVSDELQSIGPEGRPFRRFEWERGS